MKNSTQDAGPLAAAAIGIAFTAAGKLAAAFKQALIMEASERARIAEAPRRPEPRPTFKPGEILAGEVAEGDGILLAWDGSGEITTRDVNAAVEGTGVPRFEGRSQHAHIGAAVDKLRARGYVVRSARGGKQGEAKARWSVGRGRPEGQPGSAFGIKVLEVALTAGEPTYTHGGTGVPELDLEGAALAADVEAEYTRTYADDVHPPGEVTTWLQGVLVGLGAVKMGGAWYVPAATARLAEDLCCRVANAGGGWGSNWMLPAIPVMTTDQLKRGIARGALAEVRAVAADLAQRRLDAKRAGRADVGARSARGYLEELDVLAKRLVGFEAMCGMALMVGAYDEITALRRDLQAVIKAAAMAGELT